jgi:hypothetical protein
MQKEVERDSATRFSTSGFFKSANSWAQSAIANTQVSFD